MKKWSELFCPYESASSNSVIEDMIRSNRTTYHRFNLKNGKILDVYSFPKYQEGKLAGIICYAKDITKKLELESQLIQSAKLAAIGEMAAGVAHELNSPLTAILGNTQLLMLDNDLEPMETHLIKDIFNCALRCKRIIQNLLTFARQDSYTFEDISLNESIAQVLNIVGYQINLSKITIGLDLDPNLPKVLCSKQHIEQIIINLILNARDALQEKTGATIHITTGTTTDIPLLLQEKNKELKDYVYLSVSDNGAGISADILPQIFNPFFTTKDTTKGTGLGLSISLGIAEAHNGTITVHNNISEGCTFTLYIPTTEKGGYL